ncbi:hypothetical protein WA588_003556, partial [Blastocystis sp. NMH]
MPNQTEGSSSMYTSTYPDCNSTFSNVPLPYSSNLQYSSNIRGTSGNPFERKKSRVSVDPEIHLLDLQSKKTEKECNVVEYSSTFP